MQKDRPEEMNSEEEVDEEESKLTVILDALKGKGKGKGKSIKGACWECGKPGHMARDCKGGKGGGGSPGGKGWGAPKGGKGWPTPPPGLKGGKGGQGEPDGDTQDQAGSIQI